MKLVRVKKADASYDNFQKKMADALNYLEWEDRALTFLASVNIDAFADDEDGMFEVEEISENIFSMKKKLESIKKSLLKLESKTEKALKTF